MTKKIGYKFENLTKGQDACLSLVESLGIYELRALARVFGDNTPTKLRREEHIVLIMNKIISGEELRPIPLRQGRPYKELSNIEGILRELSELSGHDYTILGKQKTAYSTAKPISFKQVEESVLLKKQTPIPAKGFVCGGKSDNLFFYNQNNCTFTLVSDKLSGNLSNLDFVEGQSFVMNDNNEQMLCKIDKINYVDIYGKGKPANVDTSLLGRKYRLNFTNFIENSDKIKSLIKKYQSAGIKTIAIVPNVFDEDVATVNSLGFDSALIFKYSDVLDNSASIYLSILDFVRTQQKMGINYAIFVQDPVSIMNNLDFIFSSEQKVFMNHAKSTVSFFKELGTLPNTTIFTTFEQTDLMDLLYVSLIYKAFKQYDVE